MRQVKKRRGEGYQNQNKASTGLTATTAAAAATTTSAAASAAMAVLR